MEAATSTLSLSNLKTQFVRLCPLHLTQHNAILF